MVCQVSTHSLLGGVRLPWLRMCVRVVLLFYPMYAQMWCIVQTTLISNLFSRHQGTSPLSAPRVLLRRFKRFLDDWLNVLSEILAYNDAIPRFRELNTVVFGQHVSSLSQLLRPHLVHRRFDRLQILPFCLGYATTQRRRPWTGFEDASRCRQEHENFPWLRCPSRGWGYFVAWPFPHRPEGCPEVRWYSKRNTTTYWGYICWLGKSLLTTYQLVVL